MHSHVCGRKGAKGTVFTAMLKFRLVLYKWRLLHAYYHFLIHYSKKVTKSPNIKWQQCHDFNIFLSCTFKISIPTTKTMVLFACIFNNKYDFFTHQMFSNWFNGIKAHSMIGLALTHTHIYSDGAVNNHKCWQVWVYDPIFSSS